MVTFDNSVTDERGELLRMLAEQRDTLLVTVREISEAQAAERTTVSDLTLGGVIKHVTRMESRWVCFMMGRPHPDNVGGENWDRQDQYYMRNGETLVGLLDEYAAAARATEEAVAELSDLDKAIPLPEAPWFPPGAAWSARRILLWIMRETAQHSGHADIIRESLDGATTMKM